MKKIKIYNNTMLVVCSAGGHLTEALVATSLCQVNKVYVTCYGPHIKSRMNDCKYYTIIDPHISIIKYFVNFVQSILIYFKERPKIIFTTGAGMAIPLCVLGKIFGSTIVCLESGARTKYLSKTGKFLYKIADVFYVQWPALKNYYPKSIYVGKL